MNDMAFEQSIPMPKWLEFNLRIAFHNKDKDTIKSYHDLWKDMINDKCEVI